MVGCNYFNTSNELYGCINDVESMQKLIVERFGFASDDIVVLTDVPGSKVMPTGANIRRALRRMIDRAEPGDVLFFHYSGHGTLIPAVKPHKGHGKKDDAIVPCDFNLITGIYIYISIGCTSFGRIMVCSGSSPSEYLGSA